MFVCVNQVAGLDFASKGFHFTIPAHRMAERVPHAQPAGQGLEAGVIHLIEIPHRPVGDSSHRSERAMDVAASPQNEPTTRDLSRSCTMMIFGPGTLATYRRYSLQACGLSCRCFGLLGSMTIDGLRSAHLIKWPV